jgi:hypothetical protein
MACTQNPEPPVKSTMDPAHAEATTAAFLATRAAKTAQPTSTQAVTDFITIVCSPCVAQGLEISIWEFAGSNTGAALTSVPDHTSVQVVETITADDGLTWYKVTVNGFIGWVMQDFVEE